MEGEQRAEPPPAAAQPLLGSARPWGDRAKLVPPGEAHPQPASRGGGGRDGRERGWGSPAFPAPSPAAGAAPAPLPKPVPLAVPPDGEVRGGSGRPAGTAGPGVRGGLPAEPPLRVPPLRAREPEAGKGGGCRGWTPFPLAAPRERHGAFSLVRPLNQPFSRDFGDNLCFPAPAVRAGAGTELARGPGAAAALGTPRSRRALAACGGCGGTGMRPRLGRDTGGQAAGSARSGKRVPPRCACWEPSPRIAVFNWRDQPIVGASGLVGLLGRGDLGMRSLWLHGLCSRLCRLQLASRSRQRHRYHSLFLSILEGTLADLFVTIKGHIQAVIHTAHRLLERLCVDLKREIANLSLFGEHLGSRLRCQLLPGSWGDPDIRASICRVQGLPSI